MKLKNILAITVLSVASYSALAERTVAEYEKAMSSKGSTAAIVMRIYLNGLGEGMAWHGASAEMQGREPMYCIPETLALNRDNYVQILERRIKDQREKSPDYNIDTKYIGSELFVGMWISFPCK